MMKLILLPCFLISYFTVVAQSGFEMKGDFGFSAARVATKTDLDGGRAVDMNNFKEFGLVFSKSIGGNFRLNAGLNYAFGDVDEPNWPTYNRDFEMISVPVYAAYELGKYLYAAAGPLVDFQLSAGNNFSDQSGIGYLIGLGGKAETERLSFSIFPNYKRHSVIPFDNSPEYKQVLQELGLQFGVGYKF